MPIPPRHKPWAFNALLSLDGSASARQELAEAGVAQHRIDSLYPVAFPDLVPGLKQHLISLDSKHLYLRGNPELLNTLFDKTKQNLWTDQLSRHQRDLEADVFHLGVLRDYLLRTWAETHEEERPKLAILHPMWLWSAWWCMTHFEELTSEAQKLSSRSLALLDEVWQLPKRRSA